jgi:hypothetical protein
VLCVEWGLSSSLYSPPRSVSGGVIHGNIVNHLGRARGIFPPKLSETEDRLGLADLGGRLTPGCYFLRCLSSGTLPGGSPSGYRVVGDKFR